MSEQTKAMVRSLIEEVWNRGKFAVIDDLVAGDYIGHSSRVETETHGTEGYKQFFLGLRGAFPDIWFTVEDQIAEGDQVVCRWTARGTHMGAYAGIPPTGKQGLVTGITIYRIADGKVAQCWTQADDLGLLTQLGVVPQPAPTG